jgi:thioesterase domain-containing protein
MTYEEFRDAVRMSEQREMLAEKRETARAMMARSEKNIMLVAVRCAEAFAIISDQIADIDAELARLGITKADAPTQEDHHGPQ